MDFHRIGRVLCLGCFYFQDDLNLYDIPRAMTWCKDCICVGFKRDYFTVKVRVPFINIINLRIA